MLGPLLFNIFLCDLFLEDENDRALIQIENSTIKCSKVKKLLGVHIDYKLKFDSHVETICKKAHKKLFQEYW